MRIPEVRTEMHALADSLRKLGLARHADRLADLAEETRRRPPVRRARADAVKMTDAKRDEILRVAREMEGRPMREIARACHVDQGRVSETLAGLREEGRR